MKLHLDALIELGAQGLAWELVQREGVHLPDFLERFALRDQGFVHLPRSHAAVLQVKTLAARFKPRFEAGELKDIVVLGIGGSALGITCLRDALKGPFWNLQGSPRLFVLDNLDTVSDLEAVIDAQKTLFIVISKSGTTPETMAQYFYFRAQGLAADQFVFITDPSKGELRKLGLKEGIPLLDIPENVGGRFSVLTPVGLFPAALLGIDIDELLFGAEQMLKRFYSHEVLENWPFQMASVQYLLDWERGIPMTVLMPYSSRLYTLADWYRQLLAESIGKEGRGLTPIRALGVTDQHSQLQLYAEGPTDKLICFVKVEDEKSPQIPAIEGPLQHLSGLSFHKLMNTELEGTRQALSEYKKPNLLISIPEVNARELGELFMFFETSIAFLGEYYSINAFDQPGVELSKKRTHQLLSA